MAFSKEQLDKIQKQFYGSPKTSGGGSDLDRWRSIANKKTTETKPEPEQMTSDTQEEKQGFFSRTSERLKQTGKDIAGSFGRTFRGEQSPVEMGVQVVGEGIGAAANTAFDALFTVGAGAIKTLTPKFIEEQVGKKGRELLQSPTGEKAIDAIVRGGEFYEKYKQENPRAAANVEGILGILEIVPAGATKKLASKGVDVAATTAKQAIPDVVSKSIKERGIKKAAETVEERLLPAMTKKETRRALEEGRVLPRTGIAKKLGLRDNVQAEQKVKDAARTLAERNKNINKLSDQEIAEFAKKEVASISESIKPKLQEVKVLEDIKTDAINSYLDLKKAQLENIVAQPGQTKRLQEKFETILVEVVDADNADDVWKLVQDFDKSVNKTVKEATTQSAEATQELKNMWLDQRRILRDILDDSVEVADDSVRAEFKDMSNLYTARQNIINAARFEKGRSSFGKQLLQGTIGATVGGSLLGSIFID